MKLKNVLKSVSIVLVFAIFSTILTSGFGNQITVNKNTGNYISNEPTFENTELEKLSQDLLLAYSEFCNTKTGGSKLEIIKSAQSLKTQTQQYIDEFTASSEQTSNQISGLDNVIIKRQNEYENQVTKSTNNLIAVLDNIINQNSETDDGSFENKLKEIDTYFTTDNTITTCTNNLPNNINVDTPSVVVSDSSFNSNSVNILNDEDTLTDSALSETDEVQLSDEMKSLTDELQTPLNVYNYLKNNINYEPYYGSRKGAVATFESKAGNDVDQASLLIAMLRYLNYPSRYVTGSIVLDLETACALTYTDRIEDAANILAASGRPTSLINDNGKVKSVKIEQTWVETYVPYTDYRGTGNNSGKKMWIPLDTSIKKYEKVDSIYDDLDDLGITQETYDTAIKNNNFNAYLSNIETTVNDYYGDKDAYIVRKKIKAENLDYLPLSTQYTIISANSTYDSIENDKADRIAFSIDGKQITEKKALTLYGKRLIIEYEPETDNDRTVINKYGSIFDTPAYLVKMVPVLKLDGETIGKGKAITLGGSQQFTMTVYSDNEKRTVDNTITAGSIYQITEDMQNITEAELTSAMNSAKNISETVNIDNIYSDEYLGKILDFAGKMYFAQVDIADDILAEKMNVSATRSLSVGMTGYSVTVTTSWGVPVGINEGSLYIDIDLNVLMAVSRNGNKDSVFDYITASGMLSSSYEGVIWSEITGESGVSTISVLEEAQEQGQSIIMLSAANFESEKSKLHLEQTTLDDVRQAVYTGKIVTVHTDKVTYGEWEGYGYIITDPDTGSAAYMISGGLNGGSSDGFVYLAYLVNIGASFSDIIDALKMIPSILSLFSIGGPIGMALGIAAMAVVTSLVIIAIMDYVDSIRLMCRYLDGDESAGEELKLKAVINVGCAVLGAIAGKATKTAATKMAKKKIASELGEELAEKLLKNTDDPAGIAKAIKKLNKNGVAKEKIKQIAEVTGEIGLKVAEQYGDDAVDIIISYSDDGITALRNGIQPQTINQLVEKDIIPSDYSRLCIVDNESAEKILNCIFSDESIIKQLNLQSCRNKIIANISYFKSSIKESFMDDISGKTVSVCMDASNGKIGIGACNGIYDYNPTILDFRSQDEVETFCMDSEDYVEYYKQLLTDDYIDEFFENISDNFFEGTRKDDINIDRVKNEMGKLSAAINNTAKIAEQQNLLTEIDGVIKQYPSLEKDWYIENCAEIWAARNAILEGASFDDLIFRTEYLGNGNVHEMCRNCLVTFQGHYIVD